MEPKWLWLSVLLLLLEGCRWYSTDACWEDERIALLQLKPFFNHYNDLNSWVEEVKGSDCCQWERVECNTSSSSSRRVIGLSLYQTRWSDDERWYLNASLFLPFKELKRLDLSGNRIAGFAENEGKEIKLRMTNLEVLDLSNNLFKNDTFAILSGLPSLKSLHMGNNQLQGSIDIKDSGRQLNLTHLEEFDLSDNLIKDSIFASLSGLSNLKYLDISSNQLNGSIDMKDLGAFTNIEELVMSDNDLNEFVACKELHVWSNVEEIFLDGSYLNNNILQSIGVFTSLKTLSLSGCGLMGSLPNQGKLKTP
ncbi:leucine-rich repeat receptor-like protein FASCIATED EAR2 [Durio zibethinus]|uniref:Leucine-rich repeat receptor-like protein FASCIATED EAR2 n=1 Tax=Durio zibethinus TaxID=66656 RepID=A0A6P6B8T7_DURZI|nr:leucine-rich repeat receptor-like protein FASCIATED EAR2 [Durio zibethinus]